MLRQVLPRLTRNQEEQTMARKETISSHSPKRRMWIPSLREQRSIQNKVHHGSLRNIYQNIVTISFPSNSNRKKGVGGSINYIWWNVRALVTISHSSVRDISK